MTLQRVLADDVAAWTPRTDLQLLEDQLHAIQAWHERQRDTDPPSGSVVTREMRLDQTRRLEARTREQAALVERARCQLEEGARVLAPRAVLVHRREWVRDTVAGRLAEHGVVVVAELDNGADAIGVAVVEQPDLMLVEDALPMVGGVEVIRAVRSYCAATRIAAHVEGEGTVPALLAAGAQKVFTRRTSPADIGRQLAALVTTA